jgi:hypothetical protein
MTVRRVHEHRQLTYLWLIYPGAPRAASAAQPPAQAERIRYAPRDARDGLARQEQPPAISIG